MLSIARPTARLLAVALFLFPLIGCGSGSGDTEVGDSAGLTQATIPEPAESVPAATATAPPEASTEEPTEVPTSCDPSDTPTPPARAGTPSPACSRRCPDATESPTEPPADEPTPAAPIGTTACESIRAESHYCLANAGGEIGLLGLDSGGTCPITSTDAPIGVFLVSGSIAWQGQNLYVCGEGGLIRVSLDDGSWDVAGRPCNAVASYEGGLLVNRWLADAFGPQGPAFAAPISWYPDYEAVRNEAPEREFNIGGWSATMTAQGSTLYTAWHAGVSVDVGDLDEDRPIGVLTLEDFDGWMLGMSVTEDGYLVLISYDGIHVFDVYDGHQVSRLDAGVSALACVAGPGVTRDTPTSTPTTTPRPETDPTATPCESFDCPDPCADLASDPTPFRLHELPPSAAVESCLGGYGSSNYALPEELLVPGATEELHVVGVYEGRGHAGFRPDSQGVVDVVVHARSKPVVLALSSYEGMFWRITLDPGATLSRVILQGYGPQEVQGVPESVPVEHREPYEVCGYAYGWEVWNNGGGGGYESMMKSLRRFTGLIETSFQGCYTGDTFEIPHWSGEPPRQTPTPVAGDETLRREDVSFPGCESVTAESHYCLTTTYGGVALLGLESGNVCPLAPTSAGVGNPLATSIAWRGELMYACTEAGLVRISLRDGTWESSQIACGGVGEYDGGLLLAGSIADPSSWLDSPLHAYPDYAAVLRGEFSHAFNVGAGAFSFTVDRNTFYSSWHSTNTIDVADLTADEPRDSILLDGYDGWILGTSVVDGQLVISGDTWGDTVRIFDIATGTKLRELRPTESVYGLSCVTRPTDRELCPGSSDPGEPCPASEDWMPFAFESTELGTPCTGARYVRFLPRYGEWVGVSLCSSVRYKIWLGDSLEDVFREIGDYAGHGQDHCELVNSGFRIPDEDDITSGGCTSCDIDGAHVFEPPIGSQGWSRARFGESFEFVSSWPEHNLYTAQWYDCGVSVP